MKGVAKTGEIITIIDYAKSEKMCVQFPDGATRWCDWSGFIHGKVIHPLKSPHRNRALERIGKQNIATNGMLMTIVGYRRNNDIDVLFEDGTLIEHTRYDAFLKGTVTNINAPAYNHVSFNEMVCAFYLQQIGFKRYTQNCYKKIGLGQREFDLYNEELKIAIEYDGSLYHGNWEKDKEKDDMAHKLGITLIRIREPKLPQYSSEYTKFYYLKTCDKYSNQLLQTIKDISKYISNNYGVTTQIIFCKDDRDQILKLYIANRKNQKHIGETNYTKDGLLMTIISYESNRRVGLQIEGFTEIFYTTYENFRKGYIKHPYSKHIGETCMTPQGDIATLIKWNNFFDILISVNNQVIQTTYRWFQKRKIAV